MLPCLHFGMNRQCFDAVRLTWPAYDDSRKRENSSAWKYRIIVASTCRRSMEYGCYVTWRCMTNCVSVMTNILPLYNFTIPCHGRRAWKTSREARASAGNSFWLVESMLFGDHVSLRLPWWFSLKSNLFLINYQELTRSIYIFLVWIGAVLSTVIGVYCWVLPTF